MLGKKKTKQKTNEFLVLISLYPFTTWAKGLIARASLSTKRKQLFAGVGIV